MKIEELHKLFLNSNAVCTDTRKITKNTLFFALKGDRFNANTFAQAALNKGASYAIIDEKEFDTSKNTILVKDVLNTLQELARFHRNYLNIPIIALTGSNGKTTTKELIYTTLSKTYKTVATIGNLNNHIGVPLTLLSMSNSTEIGVVEMGANHIKEIEFLCRIAQPNFGYITNFGKAHLEGFGSIKGVIKGKCELYDYLIKKNAHIFLNADDNTQEEKLSGYIKKFGFSQSNTKYSKIEFMEADPFVKLKVDDCIINSRLIGAYNFTNIAAAILIGKYFNVPLLHIQSAIQAYIPTNNRSQIIEKHGNKIILDAYNANPSSMKVALQNLSALTADKKVAILGDMFELGKDSLLEHQAIVNFIEDLDLNQVYLIGENFNKTNSESISRYESFNEFKEMLIEQSFKDSTILIKGSRGMALERVLELL